MEEYNIQPQIWLCNFPKHVGFSSARVNSSNTTALGSFDGLHSQRQRTHQSKHALTKNSEGFKNRKKRLKNCSCLFLKSTLAKFGRADKASKQENNKQPQQLQNKLYLHKRGDRRGQSHRQFAAILYNT